MMNKRAEVGPIGAIMLFMVFIIMWFIWISKWVSDVGNMVVQQNSLTGIEGFFFTYLNFVVLICLMLGMLGFMYFGASQY